MHNLVSQVWAAGAWLWHGALVIAGAAILTLWFLALSLERALGQLPPKIVAGLPEKHQRVLLVMAVFLVKARNAPNPAGDCRQTTFN